jgi:creatinine amidohydrolase
MSPPPPRWRRYEELRPDELAACVAAAPVAFWPLGLLEHHGWHLPVGFDGIKAERICIRVAGRTGGVLLPVMWWGGVGGHGAFHWTLYQEEDAYAAILVRTVERLISFGFRCVTLLAGHYPWQRTLDRRLPALQAEHPDALLIWGTEVSIAGASVKLKGDHAAREETSFGLCLLPEMVDLSALRPGRRDESWPEGKAPPVEGRHPGVRFDPDDPLFAQMGEDARTASAERGEEGIRRVVDDLTVRIEGFLRGGGSPHGR